MFKLFYFLYETINKKYGKRSFLFKLNNKKYRRTWILSLRASFGAFSKGTFYYICKNKISKREHLI